MADRIKCAYSQATFLLSVLGMLSVSAFAQTPKPLKVKFLQCRRCFLFAMAIVLSAWSFTSSAGYHEYLIEQMDRYHSSYYVYSDASAGGNHFNERALIGAHNSATNGNYTGYGAGETVMPYSGKTAIRANYDWLSNPQADPFTGYFFSGWYFMNGVMQGTNFIPQLNFGTVPNAGIDLTGATKVTFWARGDQGGEVVEFLAQGVGREAETGAPIEPYPGSATVTKIKVTLTDQWQQYTIGGLNNKDLSYVLGGFGWVASRDDNQHLNRDIVFYIDEIKYDLSRLDEPRFINSYNNVFNKFQNGPDEFDLVLENFAYAYDNALALIAFVGYGDMDRAKLIADAFVYVINNDRYYGRGLGTGDSNPFNDDPIIRNAYQSGDLGLPPGWEPRGVAGGARLPGWWDPDTNNGQGVWYEDLFAVSTHTGNIAWTMLALLTYYQTLHGNDYIAGDPYLETALLLANWVETYVRDERGDGGYIGGIQGWADWAGDPFTALLPDGHPYKQDYGNGPKPLTYKSTEHNLDLYACFTRLHHILSDYQSSAKQSGYTNAWETRANYARDFVLAMWDPLAKHFWTGTDLDGITLENDPADNIPLDVEPWSILALRLDSQYWDALTFAEIQNGYYDESGQFTWGFDFNNKDFAPNYPDPPPEYTGETDGIWFEGTGQMVSAYQFIGAQDKANNVLNTIHTYGDAPSGGVWAVHADPRDRITTGFDFTWATTPDLEVLPGVRFSPWFYFRKQHVAPTAWAAFGELELNAFWVGTEFGDLSSDNGVLQNGVAYRRLMPIDPYP